jgi:nucleotide-binding universal stress UspA family protein
VSDAREVLVYVDPSPRGLWALDTAGLLPERERLSFHLLATEEDLAEHPDLLARARQRFSGLAAVRESSRPGPAERAVVLEARERAYDMVVVPPAGRNAIQRMLKGSRVATVVRSLRAPVLVARRPPLRFQRILAAVSGGRASERVVALAAELAAGLGAAADYLHVFAEVALPFSPHDEPVAPVHQASEAVDAARALAAAHSAPLIVREGLVADEVIEAFETGAYDLLVVGASAESERVRLGREDVTERILLGCPGCTLVVPASGLRRTLPEPALTRDDRE